MIKFIDRERVAVKLYKPEVLSRQQQLKIRLNSDFQLLLPAVFHVVAMWTNLH